MKHHEVSYAGNVVNIINRTHPKFNLARNSFMKGDFSSDYKSLTMEDKIMADFAAISYKKHRPTVFMGHTLDRETSDLRHAVYHNDKRVVFANRGTQKNYGDVKADVGILGGARAFDHTNRAKISTVKTREVMKKYPNHKIETTSHSLGAYSSMHMMQRHPDIYKRVDKQYLFNPGASSFDWNLEEYVSEKKNHFFIKHDDPVSFPMIAHTRPANLKLFARNVSLNPRKNHTIHNFTSEMNRHLVPHHGDVAYDEKATYPEREVNPHKFVTDR